VYQYNLTRLTLLPKQYTSWISILLLF